MDISGIVLHKLLAEQNLDIWAKLKLSFLDSAYASLYNAISKHYGKYNAIPTFEELEVSLRDTATNKTLAAIKLVEAPDVSAEVALDALLDQFTQNQTIFLLEKFVDKLPQYDTEEVKQNLANIVLTLDEKTLTTEGVYDMANIMLFKTPEELNKDRIYLGLNNNFDAALNGVARQELILVGGKRGSGKSITCSNIAVNQYEAGNSVVYFTIEMIAHEVIERNQAILANVPYMKLKNGTLTDEEMLRVIKSRADMFLDADDLVQEYSKNRNRYTFEQRLVKEKKLKPDNQIIIIDDRALSLTSIDLHLGKLKAKFGNKLGVCVIDYLNQVVSDSSISQFEWMPQVIVSKKLKELARKHDVVMLSPYQIDATGEARFAKGILDAADIALIMEAHEKDTNAISYNTTKIRGGPEISVTSPINWETLRISATSIEKPVSKDKSKVPKIKSEKVEESATDIEYKKDNPPWLAP